jgi:subtilisin family serine protease
MTGADVAQSQLGLTGAGVKVAVMDTGIDYAHPDLGGCFGPGCRVAYGTDLVGDAYNADDPSPVIAPDPDPMDCAGHGTHVAGIVGARAAVPGQGVTGVAPGVTFGAYRVFGCAGSTSDEIMIRAMELALGDGMQVLNMSIGSAFGWPQWPTAMAADRLVRKGMVVVASFGNSGANGLWSGGAPGLGDRVIGVASFDNVKLNLSAFSASPDDKPFGYVTATGAPPAPLSGSFPMARTGTTSTTNDACNALAAGSLTGKVVLIRRGSCPFYVKSMNAQNAGAAGVVLYNNQAGIVSPTVAGTPPVVIPVVSISAADGAVLNGRIAAGGTTLTWTPSAVSTPNATGNTISSFSSYGLSPDLVLKPDLGAPGGYIRSTYPRALGSYANLSGTSMASPHVAGAAALYLQAHPKASPQALSVALMNTATPKAWWGNPHLGFLDNVHRQGAGMLRIDQAVLATAAVTPAKLSLGDGALGPVTRTLTLTNPGSSAVTYAVTHEAALATDPDTFTVGFEDAPAHVTFSATSLTVPAGGSASVSVTVAANDGLAEDSLYGGYVVFTPDDEGNALRVPFAGISGVYQDIPVLTPTPAGFPWLAKVVGASYEKVGAGETFNLTAGEYPTFLVHLDHQAQLMRMEIFDAATGRAWHRMDNETYLPRNSTATGFFAYPFGGVTVIGAKNGAKGVVVPNGTYVMKLSLLKALGDESNPLDWEYWTSPAFTIAR